MTAKKLHALQRALEKEAEAAAGAGYKEWPGHWHDVGYDEHGALAEQTERGEHWSSRRGRGWWILWTRRARSRCTRGAPWVRQCRRHCSQSRRARRVKRALRRVDDSIEACA